MEDTNPFREFEIRLERLLEEVASGASSNCQARGGDAPKRCTKPTPDAANGKCNRTNPH